MFYQNSGLFHGPGGSDAAWLSINNQVNGEIANTAGVRTNTILVAQNYMTVRRLAWSNFNSVPIGQILGPLSFRLAELGLLARWIQIEYYARTLGVSGMTAGKRSAKRYGGIIAAQRLGLQYTQTSLSAASAAGVTSRRQARRAITKRLVKRGAVRLGARAIPILGWGFLGYDVYTVTVKGELWGVKLYEEEVVPVS